MTKEEIQLLVDIRQKTLEKFIRLRDSKNNTNAIMKEIDHARALEDIIINLDKVLENHVNFSVKK
jgi:hypothetical protein